MSTYYKLSIGNTIFFAQKVVTIPEWAKGLSGQQHMKSSVGLLFEYHNEIPRSFWMKDMNFPLDIILFGRDKKVVGILKNLPIPTSSNPPVYQSNVPIMYALEVNAGTTDGIMIGDQLQILRTIPKK